MQMMRVMRCRKFRGADDVSVAAQCIHALQDDKSAPPEVGLTTTPVPGQPGSAHVSQRLGPCMSEEIRKDTRTLKQVCVRVCVYVLL